MSERIVEGRFGPIVVGSALLAMSLGMAVHAQPPAAPTATIDLEKLGPQVGSRALDFSLHDQHGQPQTLASLMGRQGLVLVFFRSADW